MYLEQLSTVVPKHAFTQRELLDIYQQTAVPARLTPRSREMVTQVLNGDSGIEKRHFATAEVELLFSQDAESLNKFFEKEAPALAIDSLKKALDEAGWKPATLDALIVCTCTGYICRESPATLRRNWVCAPISSCRTWWAWVAERRFP
jgi:predicted naringenin-chalcone synthase